MRGETGWPAHFSDGQDLPSPNPTSAEIDEFLTALAVTTPPVVFSLQSSETPEAPADFPETVTKPDFEIPIIPPVTYPLVHDPFIPRNLLEYPPLIDLPRPSDK